MRYLPGLAFALLSTTTAWALAACKPVPGAAELWSKPALRWVWVGETHGTVETPAVFGDLVCDALAHGRRVTVALERPSTEEVAIRDLVGGAARGAAERRLLAQPDWHEGFDGRSSRAMLELLLQLRELKAKYPELQVAAVVDADAFATSPAADDEAMGRAALALGGKQAADLVMVLTGNAHGVKNPLLKHRSAAMFLPAAEVVALQVTGAGRGQVWSLTDKGCGAAEGGVADRDPSRPTGIYLDPSLARFGTVDGILALGEATSASPPADGAALATAGCRRDFLAAEGKAVQ